MAEYNQQEIFSPNHKYVALLHDSKKGYVVCPVENSETGDTIDPDYVIGWISHKTNDTGFYLHEVTVDNFKLDLIELHQLLEICCNGYYNEYKRVPKTITE